MLFLLLLAIPVGAQDYVGAPIPLDSGWRYLERDVRAPADVDTVPAAAWERVALPHTWNRYDATDATPGYRRGASWYRRTLDLGSYPAGRRFLLAFEGANTVADVWVNGRRAGGHVGGYVGFELDVTGLVRRDGPNDVLVRVDNADDPTLIPSHRSDFAVYGGLTRDVWLRVVPAVRLADVSVRTPDVTRERARATVRLRLANPERRRGNFTVEAILAGPDGRDVRASRRLTLAGDSVADAMLDLPALRSPRLWSPASPTLYRLTVVLREGRTETHSLQEDVGFRWFEFRPNGPFYLNGERLLLRGTHRHEEHAGYGAAVPNAIHRRDMEMIKAMGANFVRLAHYPQDPEVYRAADSLGLLLWDELPWDRGGLPQDAAWRGNTRRLLSEQIAQNMNHPSVILWSLGNEVADLIEEPNSASVDTLRAFLGELKAIAREMDPSRPTAMRKFDAGADVVDVYSPSIWAGWYRGVYRDYERAIGEARAKFPRFFHMEYGADAHFGRHTETPITGEGKRLDPGYEEAVGRPVANIAREGDWSESYQTDLLDWHLSVSERQSWYAGNAQWVFKDFATPLRPDNPIPYVNQKGLLTRDGVPKDAYYVFKSYWTTSPKFAYLLSHSWTERAGPPGRTRQVRVYSNCDSAELVLNGASQGTRRRIAGDFPAHGLRWDVSFADGTNALVARCAGAAERDVADSLTVRYTTEAAGRAQEITLTSRQLPSGRLLLEATLVDAKGRRSLDASDRIYFDHSGGGRLLADMGTPTGTRAIEAANGRAAIELEPPPAGTRAIVVARTQELNGARIIIEGR